MWPGLSRSVKRGRDRADAIEPGVLFRAGLKIRRSSEVVARRVNLFAAVQAIDDLLRAVAITLPVHVNHLLIVSLEHNAHLDVEYAVAAQNHPSAAARQHRPSQLRSFEVAASKPCDAPPAVRRVAQCEHRHVERDGEEKLSGNSGHRLAPTKVTGKE